MLKVDFNNILARRVGQKHGLTDAFFRQNIKKYAAIGSQIESERRQGILPFLDLPYQDVRPIQEFARLRAKKYENFVVLGIGGSALGTIALHQALNQPFYNLSTLNQNKFGSGPRLFVLDNIDPDETTALLKLINPARTVFNVVSKSGRTTETIASLMAVLNLLKKKAGKRYKDNLIITTDAQRGFLRELVRREKLVSFETPRGVEGRYSVLSPVGLLPLAFTGIDIKKILAGAAWADKFCRETASEKNPAYLTALINFLFYKKGKNILVLMPYAAALKEIANWYRQLWAESLGKKYDLNGKKVFAGSTPINALGVTDQHSQIQLYNEGPNDKLICFIEVTKFNTELPIPRILADKAETGFLAGKSFNQLMQASKRGTESALTKNQRPNYTIQLSNVSPESIGALLYFFELQTAYAGKLYNVNAFNQPGVEAGKQAIFKLLQKNYNYKQE